MRAEHAHQKAMSLTAHTAQQAATALRYIALANRQINLALQNRLTPPFICARMVADLTVKHAAMRKIIMRHQAEQFLPFRQPAA